MATYYTLLDIQPDASVEEITRAYQQQRERYSADRVAGLGDEFERVARQRSANLEQAREVLLDPERRAAYDREIAGNSAPAPKERGQLSGREIGMLLAGALAGILVIFGVWMFAGSSSQPLTTNIATLDKPAPDFALRDLSGQTVRLSDYVNNNVVMVNFWWSGCAPCEEETPALQAAYQRLSAEGLVIIGVNVRGNERQGPAGDTDIQNFLSRYGVTYPIALDDAGDAGRAYQVLPLPTTYFIDKSGTIRYASYSTVTAEDIERVFTELQREPVATR